jgi:hypothetical protein
MHAQHWIIARSRLMTGALVRHKVLLKTAVYASLV